MRAFALTSLVVAAVVACGSSDDAATPPADAEPSSTSDAGDVPPAERADGGGADGSDGEATAPCDRPKPGPTTTGVPAGTVLEPSGSIKVEKDGAIVEDLDITGTITVLANDVTIRRVRITTGDYYPIRYFDNDNRGLVVEDSEIVGTSGNVTSAIAFAHYTARRLNIHGGADGLKADSDVLIEDCWIHDLSNGEGEHNDGVQSTGGKGVTIRHNVISGASNACVQTGDLGGATEDLTIECNWLSGGGYSLNIRGRGATVPKNTKVIDNRFARDHVYGPWTLDDPSPTVTGNVYDDGTPIPYP
ncbi:MAG: right-handed parallel beta-helix repeat-containing protein [Labilithrix sp.]|nr:right-handed parallel beta-helix repeat-containing protein [Labilithrix sp.]